MAKTKPQAPSIVRPELTLVQMRTFMNHGWGGFGEAIFQTWAEFNGKYFEGKLKPICIIPSSVMPYGHCVGLTQGTNNIILAAGPELQADRGILLHEMIHQHLHQSGKNAKHAGVPWCQCIMGLHQKITGKALYAAPDKVGKDGTRSYRFKPTCKATGQESIGQGHIARWPHSMGIDLGRFQEARGNALTPSS